MKSLDLFFQSEVVYALGWTILHSLWQGLGIVFLLTISLVILRKHSSRVRYLAGYVALLGLTLSSVITFLYYLAIGAADSLTVIGAQEAALPASDWNSASRSASTTYIASEGYWEQVLSFLEGNMPLLALFWLFGVGVLSLKFLAELAYIQRLKHQPGKLSEPSYQEVVNRMAEKMGVSTFVELKESLRIGSPMVIGFIKPVILVPFGLLNQLEEKEVESILAHELAHIKRFDYLFNLLQSLVEIVLFFNPATWWISSFIRSEREHSCDEMAIRETGNQLVFVQTLAKLEEYRTLPNQMALAFTGRRDAGVLGRVKRILHQEERFRLPYKMFWSGLILFSVVGLFAFQSQPVSELMPPGVSVDSMDNSEWSEAPMDLDPLPEEELIPFQESTEDSDPFQNISPAGPESIEQGSDGFVASIGLEAPMPALDSVPENMKKLNRELIELEKAYHEQEMVLRKQINEIQSKRLQLERQAQEMENQQLKMALELEESYQKMESQRNLKQQELEVEANNLRNQTVELEFQLQQLELKMGEEGVTKELQEKRAALQNNLLELNKKRQEMELNQKRQALNLEKSVQGLNLKRWELQKEAELHQSNKRLEVMELDQKLQEIEMKRQEAQMEQQNRIMLLQLKIQQEANKLKENQE